MKHMREFPVSVLLSIISGRVLCDFGDMHEAAEFIVGHPIWTHEFASKELIEKLKAAVLSSHPDLAQFDSQSVTPGNWKEKVAEAEKKFGLSRNIRKGSESRKESPLESLERIAPNVDVIPVVIPKPELN